MDRTGRLKELQSALRYLHGRKVNEHAAYNQLKDNPRFESWIRLPKVQTLYKQLNNERIKSAKARVSKPLSKNPSVSTANNQVKKFAVSSFKATLQCDHAVHPCVGDCYGVSSDARFILHHVLLQPSDNSCTFLFHDSFNNKERHVTLQATGNMELAGFLLLNSQFGYSIEIDNGLLFISLIELDWTENKMREIQMVHFDNGRVSVLTDNLDPARIIYVSAMQATDASVQFYKLGNNKVTLEYSNVIEAWPQFCLNSFFDGKLYGFNYRSQFEKLPFPSIHVNSLEPNSQTSVLSLEWPSDNFQICFSGVHIVSRWDRDRFYIVVKFDEDEKFGIAWTSFETPKWNLMDFRTAEPIVDLQYIFESDILFLQTADGETEMKGSTVHQFKRTLYRIPFKKPESLMNLAWATLVQSKSKLPDVDPFKESRKYLPFIAEIGCPFDD